jgi:hypothetical protein
MSVCPEREGMMWPGGIIASCIVKAKNSLLSAFCLDFNPLYPFYPGETSFQISCKQKGGGETQEECETRYRRDGFNIR